MSAAAAKKAKGPRILFITPEISYVSKKLSKDAERLRAKAGGLADVSALLVHGLSTANKDIHLAIPHYRNLFQQGEETTHPGKRTRISVGNRIHLAEDCKFYRRGGVYQACKEDLLISALAFQRDLINHIIPRVEPDIIHCNDWMTGLIPAEAKKLGIPTLFTIHNIHTQEATLAQLENTGIPGGDFWDELYFADYPGSYDEAYWNNPIDLLATGIKCADHVNVVSPTFLEEVAMGHHENIPDHLSHLLYHKREAGAASGIVNAPDRSFNPQIDKYLPKGLDYGPRRFHNAKPFLKKDLQNRLLLKEDTNAPILFWPSRLDPIQKGCQLLADILFQLIEDYNHLGLQIVMIADGPYQQHFQGIVAHHGISDRVAVHPFSESLSHLGYGGSDFVLMPSSFEPCGLPQMIGARYGALPIAHATGGLKDTVKHLNIHENSGNGFLFEHFTSEGFRWAIDQALEFYQLPANHKDPQIKRIMEQSKEEFSDKRVVEDYEALYAQLVK
ncbi:MAG: glycogen/starch synthase [Akkermansiaceae bacterium]|nr:glycogen/starch synthase [Akkermansiaceae bacterium]